MQNNSSPTLSFFEELREQRWDDHRYYHQSRINQSLHFVSALCFIAAYVYVFIDPTISVFLGWVCAMSTRQLGHFFFEPKSYDHVNRATHAHKEAIKVGYNLRRKVVLIAVWALAPLVLLISPTLFGWLDTPNDLAGGMRNVSVVWLIVGVGAVALRTLYLCVACNTQRGLVWCTKILTDPFHDARIYWRSPIRLLRGELLDPMHDVSTRS